MKESFETKSPQNETDAELLGQTEESQAELRALLKAIRNES